MQDNAPKISKYWLTPKPVEPTKPKKKYIKKKPTTANVAIVANTSTKES